MRKGMPVRAKRQENSESGRWKQGDLKCGEPFGVFGHKSQTRQAQRNSFLTWHSIPRSKESPVLLRLPPQTSALCSSYLQLRDSYFSSAQPELRHCIQIIPRQARPKPLRSDSSFLGAFRSCVGWLVTHYSSPRHQGGGLHDSPALGAKKALFLEKPCLPQSLAAARHSVSPGFV